MDGAPGGSGAISTTVSHSGSRSVQHKRTEMTTIISEEMSRNFLKMD
jgi:hypothetical protein